MKATMPRTANQAGGALSFPHTLISVIITPMLMGEDAAHPSLKERLGLWYHKHPKLILIIAGAFLIVAAGVTAYAFLHQPEKAPVVEPEPKPPEKPKYFAPLTGLPVTSEKALTTPVTAIIIENSPVARPQSGIKQAEVVFEAIAEGGITRFMALYQQNHPGLVGPVRSVRSYHPDWVRPFDASVAHVGGSAKALAQIRSGAFRDIDQFFNSGSYWRASDRAAPHNVYTNFQRLDALNASKGYKTSVPKGFARADGKPVKKPNASRITIAVSSPSYTSSYVYNKKSNNYTRSLGGVPHTDREEGAIAPSVIIGLHVNEQTVWEETWREQIGTLGTGKATIFQNGTATDVTWHKPSATDQLSFTDAAGKPVALTRGQTWITAVPNGRGNVTWQ